MAKHDTDALGDAVWAELTANDVTALTFQNYGPSGIAIKATTGPVPTDLTGSVRYTMGEGEFSLALADLAPGIAATRVWAYATEGGARVSVSHA